MWGRVPCSEGPFMRTRFFLGNKQNHEKKDFKKKQKKQSKIITKKMKNRAKIRSGTPQQREKTKQTHHTKDENKMLRRFGLMLL